MHSAVGPFLIASLMLMQIVFVSSNCDPTAPPTELTGTAGTFDFPSRSASGQYFNDLRCGWIVKCPTGYNVGIRMTVSTPNNRDYWDFYNKGKLQRLAASQFGLDKPFNFLFRQDWVEVYFNSDSDGNVAKGSDGPVAYTCLQHLCSNNAAPGVFQTVAYTTGVMQLRTLHSNEDCKWTLRCGAGKVIYAYQTPVRHPGLVVLNSSGLATNISSFVYTSGNSEWKISFTSNLTIPGADALAIDWACATQAAPEPCGSTSLGISSPGRLPFPVSTVATGFNGMNCRYDLACSNGKYAALSGRFHADYRYSMDRIRFYSGSGALLGSLASGQHEGKPLWSSMAVMLDAESIVGWTTSTVAERWKVESQLDLTLSCFDTPCTLNSSALVHRMGTPSIVVTANYTNEECSFIELACANTTNWMIYRRNRGNNQITIFNTSLWQIPRERYSIPLRFSRVFVRLDRGWVDDLTQFEFSCIQSLEGICEEGQVDTIVSYGSAMPINVPKQPNGEYFNQITCVYNLVCPSGWFVAVTGEVFTDSSLDNITFAHGRTGSQFLTVSTWAMFGNNKIPIVVATLFQSDVINMTFQSDREKTAKGPENFRFRCFQTSCSSNVTDIPEVVWTQGDQPKSIFTDLGGERCTWDLKCADPELEMFFITVDTFGGSVQFTDLATNASLPAPKSFSATKYKGVRMMYTAALAGRLNVTFECIDVESSIWCNETTPPIELHGFSGTFVTPMHRGVYFNNLFCTYVISCPSNYRVALVGKMALNYVEPGPNIYNADIWDYIAVKDAASGVELGRITGNGGKQEGAPGGIIPKDVAYMWRRNKIVVEFHSGDFDGGMGLGAGFGWKCFVSDCSSNLTTPTIITHVRGSSRRVVRRNYSNEVCTYTLACAGGNEWLAFADVTQEVENIRFFDSNTVAVPYPNTSSMISAMPVTAIWDSPTIDMEFQFSYMCFFSAEYMSSACAPSYTMPLTNASGTMWIPMTPFGLYFNNMLCNWRITCPVGQNIAIRGSLETGFHDYYDYVSLINSGGFTITYGRGSWETNDKGEFVRYLWYNVREMHYNNVLNLRFQTNNLLTAGGFAVPFTYKCVVGTCSNNASDPIDVVYVSGNNLEVESLYFYESCTYRLRCADTKKWMTFEKLEGVVGTVQLFDVDFDPMPLFTKNTPITVNTIYFRYTSPRDSRHTFTANFGCFDPFGQFSACRVGWSDNRTMTDVNPSGSIALPMTPNNKYATHLQCTWRIVCANPNGGIHLRGSVNTYNASDNFTLYDKDMKPVGVFTTPSRSSNFSWDFIFHGGILNIVFASDSERGGLGLVDPFRFTCYRTWCANPIANQPIVHNGGAPQNISLGVTNDQCRLNLQCGQPNQCLLISNVSSNLTNVGFESIVGVELLWKDILPIVIPVSKLIVKWTQPQPGDKWWFAFQCVPAPSPNFCSEQSNRDVRRLWMTYTAELTATETIALTPTATVTLSLVATPTVTKSPTRGTMTISETHPATLTYQVPPTVTATGSSSITPPPTPTPTFSASLSFTSTMTMTLSGSDTDTLALTLTSTLSETATLSISEEASSTTSRSLSTERTQSTSESLTSSLPTLIRFSIKPDTVWLSTIRGDNADSSLRFDVAVIGSDIPAEDNAAASQIFQSTKFDVFTKSGRKSQQERGFASRRGNLWRRETINHTSTVISFNISVDAGFLIDEDEYVTITFDPQLFRYALHDIPVRPVTFRIVEDLQSRISSRLESVGSASALASGLLSANAAAAMKASRVNLMMDLATCSFGDGEPLDPMVYPLQAPLGPSDSNYRYFAGQMLLNPALILGFGVLHKLLGYVVACIKGVEMSAAHALVFFPSYSFVVALFFIQDSLSAIWLVLAFHSDITMKVLGGVALIILWMPMYAFITKLLLQSPATFPAWFERETGWGRFKEFLLGSGQWEDSPLSPEVSEGFCAKYGQLFAGYRSRRTFFMVVELVFTLAYSIVAAIRPPAHRCDDLLYCMLALQVSYLLLITVLVPYVALCEQIIEFLIALLQGVAAVMFIAGLGYGPLSAERRRYNGIGATCVDAVFVLMLAKAALDGLMLIQEQLDRISEASKVRTSNADAATGAANDDSILFLGRSISGRPQTKSERRSASAPSTKAGDKRSSSSALLLYQDNSTSELGLNASASLERPLLLSAPVLEVDEPASGGDAMVGPRRLLTSEEVAAALRDGIFSDSSDEGSAQQSRSVASKRLLAASGRCPSLSSSVSSSASDTDSRGSDGDDDI